jgi:hypothetical protein
VGNLFATRSEKGDRLCASSTTNGDQCEWRESKQRPSRRRWLSLFHLTSACQFEATRVLLLSLLIASDVATSPQRPPSRISTLIARELFSSSLASGSLATAREGHSASYRAPRAGGQGRAERVRLRAALRVCMCALFPSLGTRKLTLPYQQPRFSSYSAEHPRSRRTMDETGQSGRSCSPFSHEPYFCSPTCVPTEIETLPAASPPR